MHLPDETGSFKEGKTFDELLQQHVFEEEDTTPALMLRDEYREKLDLLEALLQACEQPGTTIKASDVLKSAQALDLLQFQFRRDFLMGTAASERTAFADMMEQTVKLLEASLVNFPHKGKIIENTKKREATIRSGKVPNPFE